MRKESLPDSSVVDTISRYFIPVQLDGESKDPVVFNGTEYTKNQLARGLQHNLSHSLFCGCRRWGTGGTTRIY